MLVFLVKKRKNQSTFETILPELQVGIYRRKGVRSVCLPSPLPVSWEYLFISLTWCHLGLLTSLPRSVFVRSLVCVHALWSE